MRGFSDKKDGIETYSDPRHFIADCILLLGKGFRAGIDTIIDTSLLGRVQVKNRRDSRNQDFQ